MNKIKYIKYKGQVIEVTVITHTAQDTYIVETRNNELLYLSSVYLYDTIEECKNAPCVNF